jgi:hypothetical protein
MVLGKGRFSLFPGISPFNPYGSPFQSLLNTGLTVGLGALAYKLLNTDGFAAGARKLVGDITGSEDPLGSLGKFLGGNQAKPVENAESTEARSEPKKSGVPGWLKALGIGVAGMTALNFVQDTFVMGSPLFGGFGFGYGFARRRGQSGS